MAFQLIYTSVRRGLIPGRSGYTVAARHRQIRERLVSEIERVSGYTFAKSGTSPVIYAFRKLTVTGLDFYVLTRNVDSGSDYTGRTNHLAHHLVCEAAEIENCKASPAEVLAGFEWVDRYDEDPRYFDDSDIVDLDAFAGTYKLPAKAWKSVRGEAGDAALLLDDKGRPASSVIVAGSGGDADQRGLLALYGESSRLMGASGGIPDPWSARFTTYFQSVDNLADFEWAGCTEEHSLVQRPGRRRVLNLSGLGEATPQNEYAKRAVRGGATAPPPPKPTSVPPPDVAKKPEVAKPATASLAAPVAKLGAGAAAGAVDTPARVAAPKPSVAKPPVAVGAPRPRVASADDDEGSFLSNHLGLVIAIAAAVLIVSGVLVYYLGSVQPWQRLNSEVEGHLAQQDFGSANELLDKTAKDRPGWKDRVRELRGGKVFDAMVAATEAEIESVAAIATVRDPKDARRASARANTMLREMRAFARKRELAAGMAVLDSLELQLQRIDARIPKQTTVAVTPPRDEPKDPANLDEPLVTPPDPTPDIPDPPVQPAAEIPGTVYFFLNEGLESISLPESMPKLADGEKGARKVTLLPRRISPEQFPPRPLPDGQSFDFKFPESAAEEEKPILPIGGGLNVELKFQGASTLQLLKNNAAGGADVWDGRSSKTLGFAGAEKRFQVMLWDGRPFDPEVAPLLSDGRMVVANPDVAKFLAAIVAGDPKSASPQSLLFRFTPPAVHFETPQPMASAKLALPIANPGEMKIDFAAIAQQRESEVANFTKQIELRTRAIERTGDYFEWREAFEPLDAGLRVMAKQVLGESTDLVIRFRNILDHADPSRTRRDLHDFCCAVLDEFVKALDDMGASKDDLEMVEERISGAALLEKWEGREIDAATPEEFAGFMESIAETCRNLTEYKTRRGFEELETGYYLIKGRMARSQIKALADAWEVPFAEESGEALWEFVSQRRPSVPRNLKQIQQFQREIPALMSRKVEAERSLGAFAPMLGGGLPPGRYEICLEFADGKLRPFIIHSVAARREQE